VRGAPRFRWRRRTGPTTQSILAVWTCRASGAARPRGGRRRAGSRRDVSWRWGLPRERHQAAPCPVRASASPGGHLLAPIRAAPLAARTSRRGAGKRRGGPCRPGTRRAGTCEGTTGNPNVLARIAATLGRAARALPRAAFGRQRAIVPFGPGAGGGARAGWRRASAAWTTKKPVERPARCLIMRVSTSRYQDVRGPHPGVSGCSSVIRSERGGCCSSPATRRAS
jgi:hypothetical protein